MTINNLSNKTSNQPYRLPPIKEEDIQNLSQLFDQTIEEPPHPFTMGRRAATKRSREEVSDIDQDIPSIKRSKHSSDEILEARVVHCANPILSATVIPQEAIELITPKMNQKDATKLINAIASLPAEEREEIITMVQRLVPPQKRSSVVQLIKTLGAINAVERREIVAIAEPLLTPQANNHDIHSLIQSIKAISVDRRTTVDCVADFFTPQMTIDHRIQLIRWIGRVRPAHREEAFRLAPLFFALDMTIENKISMLCTLESLIKQRSAPEIEEIIQFVLSQDALLVIESPGQILLTLAAMDNVAEGKAIAENALLFQAPGMHGSDIRMIMLQIQLLPSEERDDIVRQALRIIRNNPYMQTWDKTHLISVIAEIPADQRANYVQQRLLGQHRVAAHGINVHENGRDYLTKQALLLLAQHQQPQLGLGRIGTQDRAAKVKIAQAAKAFAEYVDQHPLPPSDKQLVQHALSGPKGSEGFGPLTTAKVFSIADLLIPGVELLGRLWIFVSALPEPDQTNAKNSMIAALKNSYEMNTRVCEQGRAQRLVIAALQGRLRGVAIDRIDQHNPVPTTIAERMFFNNPEHQKIEKLSTLLLAAEQFIQQNPLVNREEFLQAIRRYANLQGIYDDQ